MIAMNRNERSVYSVFSDRIEAYSVIELTEIHVCSMRLDEASMNARMGFQILYCSVLRHNMVSV